MCRKSATPSIAHNLLRTALKSTPCTGSILKMIASEWTMKALTPPIFSICSILREKEVSLPTAKLRALLEFEEYLCFYLRVE